MKTIDIIVPCYNEEQCVDIFYNEIDDLFNNDLKKYKYRIIYVNDGSTDGTLRRIKDLSGKEQVDYISLSRNFGKESAIYVGLKHSRGDYVVVMDADLQHPPKLMVEMVKSIEEEKYDSCAARRVNRKGEAKLKKIFSSAFYHIMNRLTVIDMQSGATDYRMMTRQMVNAVLKLCERERFTKGIYAWVGFETKWIPYENVERVAGKSKWSMNALFDYATSGIIAFATTPLRIAIWGGIIITLVAGIYGIYTAVDVLMYPERSTGRATVVLIMLFLGGVIIVLLGILGEYLARIYMEVKQRPIYLIKETNLDDRE